MAHNFDQQPLAALSEGGSRKVSFAAFAADHLARQAEAIVEAWADRLHAGRAASPGFGLPITALLPALPEVLLRAAEFVRDGRPEALFADEAVTESLLKLGRLGRAEGGDPDWMIRDFDALAQILDLACHHWVRSYRPEPSRDAVARVVGRLNRAPLLMGGLTMRGYWRAEAEEVQKLGKQMRDFADTLAHELNTTLCAAESAALLLQDDEILGSTAQRHRFAGLVERNLRRTRTVMADARKLALASATSPEGERWVPFGQVLAGVLFDVNQTIRGLDVALDIVEPIPHLRVDASLVEIVLTNLIGNAAKYSDPAKSSRWIRVRFPAAEPGEAGYSIEVSDNGLGIHPDEHPRIFQRFYRAHPTHAEGSGLGLTIVREAVRQLGGTIELESEPGVGTTFRIHLSRHHGSG